MAKGKSYAKGFKRGGKIDSEARIKKEAMSTTTADMGANRCYNKGGEVTPKKDGGPVPELKSGGRLSKFATGGKTGSPFSSAGK